MGKPNPKNSYPLFFFPSQPSLTLTASVSSKFFIFQTYISSSILISQLLSHQGNLFSILEKIKGSLVLVKETKFQEEATLICCKRNEILGTCWLWSEVELCLAEREVEEDVKMRRINEEWRIRFGFCVIERSKFWIGVVFRRARGEESGGRWDSGAVI